MTDGLYEHSRKQDYTSYEMAKLFEWGKWEKEIPYIPLKQGWKIKVIPPFGSVIVRFMISKDDVVVSVYLDCYDKMGCMDKKPYWEICPSEDGGCQRFWMNEVNELSDGINRSIKFQNSGKWMRLLRYIKMLWGE